MVESLSALTVLAIVTQNALKGFYVFIYLFGFFTLSFIYPDKSHWRYKISSFKESCLTTCPMIQEYFRLAFC